MVNELDLEKLKEESDQASNQKAYLGVIGNVLDGLKTPSSYEMLHGGKIDRPNYSKMMNDQAALIEDPAEKRSKLAKAYLENRGLIKAKEEDEKLAANKDASSNASKAAKAYWMKQGLEVNDADTAQSLLDRYGSSADFTQTKAKSQIDLENKKAMAEYEAQLAKKYPKPKDPVAQEMQSMRIEQMKADRERREKEYEEKHRQRVSPSEKHLEELKQYDDAITSLEDMLASKKKNYVGAVDGIMPEWTVDGDEAAFRSKVGRYSDAYRKLITGAGASNMELKRLEGRLPGITDTEENFAAKAQEILKEQKRARNRYLDGLEKIGKNVSDFRGPKEKTVVKTQTNKLTGEKRLVYDDGSTEIVSGVAGR